jgi:aspartate oxidase
MDTDVIVVGAGLAGLMGAGEACGQGAGVLLVSRIGIGLATNSGISNGVIAGPTRSYALDEYIRDTRLIGKGLNSLAHIEAVAREIGPAITLLRQAGCTITEAHEHYAVGPSRPDGIPGVTLMKTVAASVKKSPNLAVRTGFQVTGILRHDGRVCGVEGIDQTGRYAQIHAPAVILATGGAGAAYLRNDNQKRALGQGYAMALRAGLELRDLEFVQFYPFIHAQPGVPAMLLYPPVPENARLINAAGRDLTEKYGLGNLNELILKKRDALSALLHDEMRAGPLCMDYRAVPADHWTHPPLAMLAKLKFDFRHRPFAIAPGAHFFMGGIRTEPDTRTDLPGLFACGEVAWGLHGANRRGGNALAECLVFGRIAGERAARWALSHPLSGRPEPTDRPKHVSFGRPSALARLRQTDRRFRKVAWDHAGLVRTEEGLRTGLVLLSEVEADLNAIEPGTAAEFNQRSDQLGACLVLRAIFAASLARQESVGSFKRKDFPNEQERSTFGNSCIHYDAAADQMSVTFTASRSVTFTARRDEKAVDQ